VGAEVVTERQHGLRLQRHYVPCVGGSAALDGRDLQDAVFEVSKAAQSFFDLAVKYVDHRWAEASASTGTA
jgi:hypothetical protein